jgi:tetratricopeptide (TPR) repeat protein
MDKKYKLIIIVFLIAASCIAFGRITGNGFINLDDNAYITENHHIQQGINPESLKWAATAVVVSNWHPLTLLSHMLDWSLFGASASGHHLVSLLLHIGAVLFLFLFLNKTTSNLWPSAFAAALFALHPLRVESVAWAAERKDVLSLFFGMAGIYAYAFWAERSKLTPYLLSLILFVLALMSKPMLVTLPFVLMLLDYWPLKRWQKVIDKTDKGFNSAGPLILEKVPFVLLAIVSSIITLWAHNKGGSVASDEFMPFLTRIANAIISYAAYLGKIFWPVNLAVYYPYDYFPLLWKVLISGSILTGITIVVLYYIRKLPFLFVGWFWYMGTLIPVIGLVQVGTQSMADRYTYLPSIGISVALAWGFSSLIKNYNIRKGIFLPTGIAILSVLTVLTWIQCGYWKNSTKLFSHTLQITKDNYIAHNHLASALLKKRKFEKAIFHYTEAIRINPYYAHAYYNRGNVYYLLGQKQLAIEDFKKAISTMPRNSNYASAYNNLGSTYADLGQYQLAIDNYNEAILLKPDYADAYNNLAFIYLNQANKKLGCHNAQKACALGNCKTLESVAGRESCR